MTSPGRFLTRMILFLLAVAAVAAVLYQPLMRAFQANVALNGLILAVLFLGIAYTFRQVLMLRPEVRWIETFRRGDPGLSLQRLPSLLAPMAKMLSERQASGRMSLSALSLRSLLDTVSSRLDERHEIARYFIGLLIFLGLLGTFWGLLDTVTAVGDTIGSLTVASGDFNVLFGELKAGLEAPLAGMGVAFSSSLFGLAGSLALGFLDLQASQAQNRFYNDLEEWLSSFTRLSGGAGFADGDQSVPVYVQALLEQTADSLEGLQRTIARAEESRTSGLSTLLTLSEKLATLTDQMRAEQDLLVKLAESQMEMKPALQRLATVHENDRGGLDEASRTHLRNIDVCLMRLLEDLGQGRDQTVSEVRSEIKLLARTIAALGDERV